MSVKDGYPGLIYLPYIGHSEFLDFLTLIKECLVFKIMLETKPYFWKTKKIKPNLSLLGLKNFWNFQFFDIKEDCIQNVRFSST